MSRRTLRGLLALPALGVLGAILAWGASGLAPFGHFHGFYGQLLNAIALPQRHTTNTVTAIVFDYRGIYMGVAVVCAAVSWISGLVFARFLGRL